MCFEVRLRKNFKRGWKCWWSGANGDDIGRRSGEGGEGQGRGGTTAPVVLKGSPMQARGVSVRELVKCSTGCEVGGRSRLRWERMVERPARKAFRNYVCRSR